MERMDREKHPAQYIALTVGIVYTLLGLLGFLVTGFDNFAASDTDEHLLGLQLNPLHNIAHLLVGLLGLAMWKRLDSARTYGWLLLVLFAVLALYGFAAGETPADILALNAADNLVHVLTALTGLAIAMLAGRGYRPTMTER